MEKNDSHMTEVILNLTLEIIYLLTGEDYVPLKKSIDRVTQNSCCTLSEGCGTQVPIMEPPPPSLIQERDNDLKILDLTKKIIHLLTGEVPIRCQDFAVYFSMEEWEYVERHQNFYKDVKIEKLRPLASLGGSSNRTTPERCPSPLSSHESSEDSHSIQQDYQVGERNILLMDNDPETDESQTDVKIKEEEILMDISPDGLDSSSNTSKADDIKNMTQESQGENSIVTKIPPVVHNTNSPKHEGYFLAIVKYNAAEGFVCSVCKKTFGRKDHLILHSRVHTGEKPFSCPECGKCFAQKSNLIRHQQTHKDSHKVEKPFSCSECDKHFTCKSTLVKHQRIHTGQKPFPCSECGKCFRHKSHVVAHEKVHTGEKPFTCSKCGKCFTRELSLVYHQRIHTGEKPFKCPECGSCFTHKSTLVKHQIIHSGAKPFSCSDCGKCFTQKALLVEHQRNHTGDRPFVCPTCGKGFTRRSDMVKHQKTHTGEKPFTCSECGNCFSQKSNLVKHQKIHSQIHN